MYRVKVSVKESSIEGRGVFAEQNIKPEEIVWVFDRHHDKTITKSDFEELSPEEKHRLERVAYLSPWSGLWVYPPKGDAAEYTNHSESNNLSVKFDKSVSIEPYFVANRNIQLGEELTNNYHEFDHMTQTQKPHWARQ